MEKRGVRGHPQGGEPGAAPAVATVTGEEGHRASRRGEPEPRLCAGGAVASPALEGLDRTLRGGPRPALTSARDSGDRGSAPLPGLDLGTWELALTLLCPHEVPGCKRNRQSIFLLAPLREKGSLQIHIFLLL